MDKKTIYVAGPMRGYDNWNYDAFNAAERMLESRGWRVINPANLDSNYEETAGMETTPEGFNPDKNKDEHAVIRKIMKRDCDVVCDECDAVYMLKGYGDSKGAMTEMWLAKSLGLDIFFEMNEGRNNDRDCYPEFCRSISVGGKIPTTVN